MDGAKMEHNAKTAGMFLHYYGFINNMKMKEFNFIQHKAQERNRT